MIRNRAYYRYQRNRAINRKLGILRRLGGDEYVWAWTRGRPGRLAKGKIHCSCPLCRQKSYDSPTHRDMKQKESAGQQLAGLLILLHGIIAIPRWQSLRGKVGVRMMSMCEIFFEKYYCFVIVPFFMWKRISCSSQYCVTLQAHSLKKLLWS